MAPEKKKGPTWGDLVASALGPLSDDEIRLEQARLLGQRRPPKRPSLPPLAA